MSDAQPLPNPAPSPPPAAAATKLRDVEAVLRAFDLPVNAAACVRNVVKRSRLWRSEKLQLAIELSAHFRDGLDAGQSEAELVNNFGDVAQTAKLIRRAKKRNRSLLWQIQRRTFQALTVFVLLYAALVGYAYFQAPSINVNFLHELNAPAEKVKADERAWPLYREAAIQLGLVEKNAPVESPPTQIAMAYHEHKPLSPELHRWLRDREPALALVRLGASKSGLGYVHRFGRGPEDFGPEYTSAFDENAPIVTDPYANNQPLIGVILPYVGPMRHLAQFLAVDADLAAGENDTARMLADLNAMDGLARHGFESPILINTLVGYAIRSIQLKSISQLLVEHPQQFSDQALLEMAHRLARWEFREPMMRALKGERAMFADMVQRIYTDDGHGNGRLTTQGIDTMRALGLNWFEAPPPGTPKPTTTIDSLKYETQTILAANGETLQRSVLTAGMPVLRAVVADRQELVNKYEMTMSRYETLLVHKKREVAAELDQQEKAWRDINQGSIRYALLHLMLPALPAVGWTAEQGEVTRDGVLLGIALELFHRREGRYPETLAELLPRYMPVLPVDPMNGEPLKYRVTEKGPIVYSVGRDRKDDGGVSPADPRMARSWDPSNAPEYQGDWVLWPMPVK